MIGANSAMNLKVSNRGDSTGDGIQRGYENLGNAIVEGACHDYISAKISCIENVHNKGAESHLNSIKRFFNSQYCASLTKLDPQWLMKKMDALAQEKVAERQKEKAKKTGEDTDAKEMCSM